MRLIKRLVRVTTWVVAAIGIKAMYDQFRPKANELPQPAAEVLDTTKATEAILQTGPHPKDDVPDELRDAARQELEYPADETNEA